MRRTIMRTSFKDKRPKVKITRPITAETESISYLPNGKDITNFKTGTPNTTATATASYKDL